MSSTEPKYMSTEAKGKVSSQIMLPAKTAQATISNILTASTLVLRAENQTATAASARNMKSSQWYSSCAVKLAALDSSTGMSRQWMRQPTELAIPIQSDLRAGEKLFIVRCKWFLETVLQK